MLVETNSGPLRGVELNAVVSFKGVRYAKPPIGQLRWAPPQPTNWNGALNASKFALPCLQPTSATQPNGAGVTGASSDVMANRSDPERDNPPNDQGVIA